MWILCSVLQSTFFNKMRVMITRYYTNWPTSSCCSGPLVFNAEIMMILNLGYDIEIIQYCKVWIWVSCFTTRFFSAEDNIRTVGLTTAGATPHVWFWWCWVPLPECHDESGQTCGQLPCWNCTGCKSEADKVHHPGWDFARVCKSGRWWTVQSHRYLP